MHDPVGVAAEPAGCVGGVVDVHAQLDGGAGRRESSTRRAMSATVGCGAAGATSRAVLVEDTDDVAQLLERLAGGGVDEPGGAFDLGRWEI